ncbi:XrtA system polysaccharide deacetylase [Calycomorphotria hydatis]|uniref:Undecaprenyl-phosphate N-acetylgalactosaminyl 1-phosphate transferase n=1 Tax=Calycomorphotria hydatis TaxID=2528027 RepID=A0A517T4J5_9PLAN|nr:XrtA system polysaccharide deacetylase [Calycomorphotria hydatis]QDT63303.1 Putative undecaprenyl-phosphate N-acetylgalactosaminyl 1-phosphate transferase [Calycomorphotria hydatis]
MSIQTESHSAALDTHLDKEANVECEVPMVVPENRNYLFFKRAMDLMFAIALSVMLLPVLAVIGLVVMLTSHGGAIYTQQRVGRNGRLFVLYKFRTMTQNAEATTGATWSSGKHDPRVTAPGRVLRATHLDELPQLWNVLCGDMSLIGPRPERPAFVEKLEHEVPKYTQRLGVKPGITGIAQLQLPPDKTVGDVRRKIAYDRYYVQHVSFWLDLKILLSTAGYWFKVIWGLSGMARTWSRFKKLFAIPKWETVKHYATSNELSQSHSHTPELALASLTSSGAFQALTTESANGFDSGTFAALNDSALLNAIPATPASVSAQPSTENTIRNVFSVDVEDYFHVSGFADIIKPDEWDQLESRVVANTHRILDLLDQYNTPGLFFVLGWVAERYPQLVEEIASRGHEVGSHGYNHQLLYRLTPDEFRDDLTRSRDLLSSLTGKPVQAYRAPSFTITRKTLWALDILVEEGFLFDSSIFPIHHDRYGIPDADRHPELLQRKRGLIWEFPPAVARVGGVKLPVGGGGYFRLLPSPFTLSCLERINTADHQPFMFYVHPWEIDPEQPRLPAKMTAKLRHYVNLHRTQTRLERLLTRFQFGALHDVLDISSVADVKSPEGLDSDTATSQDGVNAPR